MATYNPSDPLLLDLHIVAIAADKYAVYSSIPVDKSVDNYWGVGPAISVVGPSYQTGSHSYQTGSHPSGKDSTPPDCGSKSKPPPHSGDKSDSKGNSPDVTGATPVIATAAPLKTNTGPGPAIARRHFRDRMRRNNKASPSILGRDDPATIASNNPITFGDIVDHLIRKRAASRKRAERPRTSRGVY